MRKLLALLAVAATILVGCGSSEYDPEMCALWTDLFQATQTGEARVEMDRYCTR